MPDDPGLDVLSEALGLTNVPHDLSSALHEPSLVFAGQGWITACWCHLLLLVLLVLLALEVAEVFDSQLQNVSFFQFVEL